MNIIYLVSVVVGAYMELVVPNNLFVDYVCLYFSPYLRQILKDQLYDSVFL